MLLTRVLRNVAKQTNGKLKLPKVVVFDLDHTVWPFGIDSFKLVPPYHYYHGKLIDMCQQEIKTFPDIKKIFEYLHVNGVEIAAASRTQYPTGALHLLNMLGFDKYINYYEIYPGQKLKHFEKIQIQSGAKYNEMVFFDDEERNIIDISPLGVMTVYINSETGVTMEVFEETMKKYSESKS